MNNYYKDNLSSTNEAKIKEEYRKLGEKSKMIEEFICKAKKQLEKEINSNS